MSSHLWQSTVFAALAGLLILTLHAHRARVRHAIWMAAMLKFLLPFSLLIGLGTRLPKQPLPVSPPPAVSAAVSRVSVVWLPPAAVPPASLPAARFLTVIWLCGIAGFAVSWWIRWRGIARIVRAATPLDLELPIRTLATPSLIEPGVFGIFRPVLLLPEGIANRLTPAQFRAVLAHELAHVRHRDNLAAAVQMLVETAFWFHPLVWWIGRQMVKERERACDEEVLLGNEARDYAEGILNVCKLYVESPLACVSGITGPDLRKRIETILCNRASLKLRRPGKIALAAAGVGAIAAPILIGMQSSAPAARFDVVSVKRGVGCMEIGAVQGLKTPSHGRLDAPCVTLQMLISTAYGNFADEARPHLAPPISGGPDWVESEFFAIDARADAATPLGHLMGPMLRAMLEGRFQVKVHREAHDEPVYEMTVDKGGIKLKPTKEGSCQPFDPNHWPEDLLAPKVCGQTNMSGGASGMVLDSIGTTVGGFVGTLAGNLDRPIVDKTGLTRLYDIHLEFSNAPDAPGLPAALQHLGLKLTPGRGPVEHIVIDHAEMPSGN